MVDDIRANKRYSCHHFHTHVYTLYYLSQIYTHNMEIFQEKSRTKNG